MRPILSLYGASDQPGTIQYAGHLKRETNTRSVSGKSYWLGSTYQYRSIFTILNHFVPS